MAYTRKKTKVYKVVSPDLSGRLRSAFIANPHSITYTVGEKATPPITGTKLFAFLSRKDALSYAGPHSSVYEALATGLSKKGYWMPGARPVTNRDSFNENLTNKNIPYPSTILCASITLTQKIR